MAAYKRDGIATSTNRWMSLLNFGQCKCLTAPMMELFFVFQKLWPDDGVVQSLKEVAEMAHVNSTCNCHLVTPSVDARYPLTRQTLRDSVDSYFRPKNESFVIHILLSIVSRSMQMTALCLFITFLICVFIVLKL